MQLKFFCIIIDVHISGDNFYAIKPHDKCLVHRQASLIWRSVLDIGTNKLKLTLGKKKNASVDQIFTFNDLVPKLHLGGKSALHGRLDQFKQMFA
jgi:hypothetical protein